MAESYAPDDEECGSADDGITGAGGGGCCGTSVDGSSSVVVFVVVVDDAVSVSVEVVTVDAESDDAVFIDFFWLKKPSSFVCLRLLLLLLLSLEIGVSWPGVRVFGEGPFPLRFGVVVPFMMN